jgi:hypothetical protein
MGFQCWFPIRLCLGVISFVCAVAYYSFPALFRHCIVEVSFCRFVSTIRLSSLVPSEVYYFQVGSKGALYSKVFSFQALPSTNKFTFVAGGDIGIIFFILCFLVYLMILFFVISNWLTFRYT